MPIKQLTSVSSLVGGDNFPISSLSNGDDRKASLTLLLAWIQANLSLTDALAFPNYLTQYAAPSATGFSIQVTDADDNIYLIITPVAGYAAGAIVLPTSSNVIDGQEVLCNCTQAVTALTIDGNGATVVGGPTTLAANAYFRLRYDLPGTTWYRVG